MADLDVIPTDSSAVEKELRRVQTLMQLEQKEDLAQFKLKSAKASIHERKKSGLTYYRGTLREMWADLRVAANISMADG